MHHSSGVWRPANVCCCRHGDGELNIEMGLFGAIDSLLEFVASSAVRALSPEGDTGVRHVEMYVGGKFSRTIPSRLACCEKELNEGTSQFRVSQRLPGSTLPADFAGDVVDGDDFKFYCNYSVCYVSNFQI